MIDKRILDEASQSIFWTNWRLQLTIPSVLARGEEFSLRITAFGPDGLPSEKFRHKIVFEKSPGIEGLPTATAFSKIDNGHIVVSGLKAVGTSHAFVMARPEGAPGGVRSNPAWIFDDPPYRVYWGDLHVHTTYGNCSAWACKDPEFCYAYAREATHLDFAAAADHLDGIAADPKRWPRLQELVREYDAPGRFVPFLAFESSHKSGFGGDNNAYFLGADAPYFWIDHKDMWSVHPEIPLQELWNFLDAADKEYFTVPHHTGRAKKYRSFADPVYAPQREPLFEIYSGWGSSECTPSRFPLFDGNSDKPCYFQDALRAGCRFGVIASSDNHLTMPGGEGKEGLPASLAYPGLYEHKGLVAVRAPDLSRESLWKALRQKNCYATTFCRTLLDVRIGDLSMGQAGAISSKDPLRCKREIRVHAFTTAVGDVDVVLVRNGKEMTHARWDPEQPEVVFVDQTPLDEIAIRDSLFHPDPFVVYYVRLDNGFGHTQWSSPIWLDLDY